MGDTLPRPSNRPARFSGGFKIAMLVAVVLPLAALFGGILLGAVGALLGPVALLGGMWLTAAKRATMNEREAVGLLRGLASAVRRGVPLDRACAAAAARGAGAPGRRTRAAASRMADELGRGEPLCAALDAHLPALPPADRRAVAVAENRGTLPATLARIAASRSDALADAGYRVGGPPPARLLLAEGGVLLAFALTAWLFVRLFIYPKFVEIFDDFDTPMPALTRRVFGLGHGGDELPLGYAILVVLAVLFVALLVSTVRRLGGSRTLGPGRIDSRLAWTLWPPHRHRRWSAAFATAAGSLRAGVDLPEALGDAAVSSSSRVAAARLRGAAAGFARGAGLPGLPPLARGLLEIPPGPRASTFEALAAASAGRAAASSALLTSLVLPGLIVLAAAPVALFALALLVTLVRLIESLNLEVFSL